DVLRRRVASDAAKLGKLPLGGDDGVRQNLAFGVVMAVGAGESQDEFLKVQQPVRQIETGGVDRFGLLAEHRLVFIVNVEHDNMGVLKVGQDPTQDARHRAGFAATRRSHDDEVLRQQVVDQKACRNQFILVKRSDFDRVRVQLDIDAG